MNDQFIIAEELSYKYEGDNINASPVLNNLSVNIKEGEFVAILGHNGSGKSTFAKLLNMILTPTTGKIYFENKDMTASDMTEEDILSLRKNIGMVFQNPDNQLIATIVEDDVAFGPENLGIPSEEIKDRVIKTLTDVGMLEYAHHEPHRLSGGQKQRVAIAGILAMMPRCIIFDESTAMLDPVGRNEVMEAILRLNKEKNITVIMITHYMEEAAMADRIIVLDNGDVLLDGTPEYVFDHEDMLKQCGLAVPQCTELVHRLKKAGFSLEGKCITPEQCADMLEDYLKREANSLKGEK